MSAALGLLALTLLGADGSAPARSTPLLYQVKLLEMDGLGWRESIYSRLQPVARQGTCTIWTAGRDLMKPLMEKASHVVMNPQVMAMSDSMAHYSHRTSRRVASQLTRHADGPIDHAVAVAYVPHFEEVREGCQFTLTGRKLDQGILTRVIVEETRVSAIHQVKLSELVVPKDKLAHEARITPQLDVPEIVKATVEGEWLIPNDGMLVASLGANTADDGHGKAVVRERLLLIEAAPAPSRGGVGAETAVSRAFTFNLPARAATTAVPMPVPSMPSRSLPEGRTSDGTPVPLPPLPESQVPPTSLPGSSEPCATPQTPQPAADKPKADAKKSDAPQAEPREKKSLDPESTQAGFQSDTKACPAAAEPPARSMGGSSGPLLFRVPLSAGVTIEIRARVTPTLKP